MTGAGRPLAFLDVDGVIALQDPEVPVIRHSVTAYGKWRRDILVPAVAPDILREIGASFTCVWATAWSHTAHPALQAALGLPAEPWPWLPVQFHKLAAIRAYAAGRPWVWVDDGIDDLGPISEPDDGVLCRVDSRRGLADVAPADLVRRIGALPERSPTG